MELLAWDKETDTAILPERAPNNLEWARFPSGVRKQYNEPVIITPSPIYSIANATVQVNGNAPQGLSTVYFGTDGDSLSIELDIVDGDNTVQSQIDQTALGYPPVLALPIVKTVGTSQAEAELYLTTTITNGHMVASIVANRLICGNWMLLESRVNDALAEIGADWKISMDNISFRML